MTENKESKFNKVKYDNDYIKNNYDQVRFTVKKGKKEELQKHCKEFGYKSLNSFINEAVNEKIARDLENKE
mgnify:CR=1 FL=1